MNILAVPPVLHEEVVVQMRIRLDAKAVPANTFKGLRDGIDARVRPGLHKEAAAPRAVHTIYNLVEFFMCCFADELLFIQGARSSMGAELGLYSYYPWEGGEPAPHGSVRLLDLRDGVEAAQIQGEWAGALPIKGLPGAMRLVNNWSKRVRIRAARRCQGQNLISAGLASVSYRPLAPKTNSLLRRAVLRA